MFPNHLIIQSSGSYEARSMISLAMRRDIRISRCGAAMLRANADALEEGAIPIGSVEFLAQAMKQVGIKPPHSLSYPKSLTSHLNRQVQCLPFYDAPKQGEFFIKPAGAVKLFDGFVLSDVPADDPVEEQFRAEQRAKLFALPGATPVFISDLVEFESEWRVYVLKHQIVGMARYDDGNDGAPEPSSEVVGKMIRQLRREGGAPVAYGLDVGVIKGTGQTALVEVNDAWALGLYRDMTDHEAYLQMLTLRWKELLKAG